MDINELDNLLHGLLECSPHCASWVWEEGASPSRSRRCKWGRNLRLPLSGEVVSHQQSVFSQKLIAES
jgi:hypothetical protein